MTPTAKTVRPIIVIKKKVVHGGHHGGAWKVAYADFVTAMMSLFIVLWLMNSTPQVKKAVAGYFNDPKSSGQQTGIAILGTGESISIDKTNAPKLKEEIEKAILQQADLSKLSKQVEITLTGEGLKIELIEDRGGTFFESGSPKLNDNGVGLLNVLAGQLKALPNRLLIEGHTDAKPFSSDLGYTNWELSSDRANSARHVLQQAGVGRNQITQVRGYADQLLRVPANPLDASNRRISLIVQWADSNVGDAKPSTAAGDAKGKAAEPGTERHAPGDAGGKDTSAAAGQVAPTDVGPASSAAKPGGPPPRPAKSAQLPRPVPHI